MSDIISWLLSEFVCNLDAQSVTYSKLLMLAFSKLKTPEQFLLLTVLSWGSHKIWKMVWTPISLNYFSRWELFMLTREIREAALLLPVLVQIPLTITTIKAFTG